jgi:hypothetical protein
MFLFYSGTSIFYGYVEDSNALKKRYNNEQLKKMSIIPNNNGSKGYDLVTSAYSS